MIGHDFRTVLRRTVIASVAIFLSSPLPASANPTSPDQTESRQPSVLEYLTPMLLQGTKIEDLARSALQPARKADLNGDGTVTEGELKAAVARWEHLGRVSLVSTLLLFDTDLDGFITKDEIEKNSFMVNPTVRKQNERLMEMDADGDGKVSYREAAETHRPGIGQRRERDFPRLDIAKDGALAIADLHAAVIVEFEKLDADNNSVLTRDELEVLRPRSITQMRSQGLEFGRKQDCTLPAADAGVKVVGFGAYEGQSVSSAAIGSFDDVTLTSKVVIENGGEPLYVILDSTERNVWRFEGEIGRVARVVIIGTKSGLTGIPREKVSFVPYSDCKIRMPHKEAVSQKIMNRGILANALVTEPDGIALHGRYEHDVVFLPSGRTSLVTRKPDTFGDRFNPGGVVTIDPATVVAAENVATYDVLPQHSGLFQLVTEGALERFGRGGSDTEYRILRQIPRFPAGLTGAVSTRFVLAKGVPMPGGSPGHSCVISEDTHTAVSGICR